MVVSPVPARTDPAIGPYSPPGGPRIADLPSASQMVRFSPGAGQRFLLTIDTEEEFDWTQPFSATRHRVDTIPRLRKFQQFCESYGIVPVYLVDYPIASLPLAAELLREAIAAGRAEIGVQLHAWVNPPFHEELNEYNSFAGNLPYTLERAKLLRLTRTIARNFGTQPLIYRAGRYGTGPHTAAILREAGIAIDSSVRARFDYSDMGGTNYNGLPIAPWWIAAADGGDARDLIELPLTTVFAGLWRRRGSWLYPRLWRVPRMRGVLARLGLLERIPLTPEGVTIAEALRAVDIAIADALPVLVLSFHSPSLCPGFTPYVRDEADLDMLYAWWRAVVEHLRARGVQPTSVAGIMASTVLA